MQVADETPAAIETPAATREQNYEDDYLDSIYDDFVPVNMADTSISDPDIVRKWTPCGDHNLQLVLKTLDKDTEFSKFKENIMTIVGSIRRSSKVTQQLWELTQRIVITPIDVR